MKIRRLGLAVGILALLGLGVGAEAQLPPPQRCAAAKFRAAGKLVDRLLVCQAKRAIEGLLDGDCVPAALRKYRDAFQRAENLGCAISGDGDVISAPFKSAIDETVFALLQETCALLGNMDGTVSCEQNPHVPACTGPMGCVLGHFDARRAPLFFCNCQ